MGALSKKVLDVPLVFEHQVEISLGRRGVIPARPLHSDISKFCEGLDQSLLGDIPRDATKEDLGGVRGSRGGGGGSLRKRSCNIYGSLTSNRNTSDKVKIRSHLTKYRMPHNDWRQICRAWRLSPSPGDWFPEGIRLPLDLQQREV